MGLRLYNPIRGGNTTAYTYPKTPLTTTTSAEKQRKRKKHAPNGLCVKLKLLQRARPLVRADVQRRWQPVSISVENIRKEGICMNGLGISFGR